jgi:hypothetical protein
MGGDQFDHDCRPRSAVGFAPHVTCTHSRSNVLQPINGACRCRTTKSSARGSSGLEEPATGEGSVLIRFIVLWRRLIVFIPR